MDVFGRQKARPKRCSDHCPHTLSAVGSPSAAPHQCQCNGASIGGGYGGTCGEWDNDCRGSGGWCYVAEGACPDAQQSSQHPDLFWACSPCNATSASPSSVPLASSSPSSHATPLPGMPACLCRLRHRAIAVYMHSVGCDAQQYTRGPEWARYLVCQGRSLCLS